MTFSQLGSGVSVFIDANTIIFHLGPHPVWGAASSHLMHRIEIQDLEGYSSTHVLAEAAHRLMVVEATLVAGWVPGKVARRLKSQPGVLQHLTRFQAAIESILQSKVRILAVSAPLLRTAMAISRKHGLLTNDALIVAQMQSNGLANIASNDADFDRVPGIVRYGPA